MSSPKGHPIFSATEQSEPATFESLEMVFSTFEITDKELRKTLMKYFPEKYPLAKIIYED